MKVKINGQTWRLDRPEPPYWANTPNGECDAPEVPNKRMWVRASLEGEQELDILLHEMLHASAYHVLAEEFVTQTATDIAHALWKLGYRKKKTK